VVCFMLVSRVPSSTLSLTLSQKLHGVVRPLSLKTDVIKKRCVQLILEIVYDC
jgi:hypothetical protein